MRRSELKRGGFSKKRSLRQPSLYSRTEETKKKKGFGWAYPVLFLICLVSSVYFIFFSPYLQIKEVVFSDTKYVSRSELNDVVRNSRGILNNNIITFGFFNFESRLGEVIGVRSFHIKRRMPNKIFIEVEEKSPAFVWQILDRKYLVDESGYVWANYEEKYASLPHIIDTKNVPVEIGSRIAPTGFVSFVTELCSNFENTTGTKIVKIEVLDIVSDLKVTSGTGWYVYFDTTRTARNQLTSLVRVLEETRKASRSLEYVDLRIDNRIFYK